MRFLIFLVLIGAVIWYFFFRRGKKPSDSNDELMVECHECGTYVSSKEAFFDKGKTFCSKKCLRKENEKDES